MLGEFASNENSGQVNGIDQSNPFSSYIVYIYKYIPIHMYIIEYTQVSLLRMKITAKLTA
jgi:hypothetical protein